MKYIFFSTLITILLSTVCSFAHGTNDNYIKCLYGYDYDSISNAFMGDDIYLLEHKGQEFDFCVASSQYLLNLSPYWEDKRVKEGIIIYQTQSFRKECHWQFSENFSKFSTILLSPSDWKRSDVESNSSNSNDFLYQELMKNRSSLDERVIIDCSVEDLFTF